MLSRERSLGHDVTQGENVDFQLVKSKRTERYCVRGLSRKVNLEVLTQVLRKKGLLVKYIESFPVRANPEKALVKICLVNDENSHRIMEDDFWPSYVTCERWRSREEIRGGLSKNRKLSRHGYVPRVQPMQRRPTSGQGCVHRRDNVPPRCDSRRRHYTDNCSGNKHVQV
ncbi:hypothetical protein DPMN_154501 [Dreissena polymorpha]|uniref:Uncharacterized protein n=1 Tax=Dreissena polymorpha TaxID=45954 RepID=A0A9D4FL53_DREPO|nr:hypothetical protein DPMN_154501 [Dreissena polymorpha]